MYDKKVMCRKCGRLFKVPKRSQRVHCNECLAEVLGRPKRAGEAEENGERR